MIRSQRHPRSPPCRGQAARAATTSSPCAAAIMSPRAAPEQFRQTQEVDLAYSVPGLGRFRVQRLPAARHGRHRAARHPDAGSPSIDELGLPPVAQEDRRRRIAGLVLVTGTTGSGKSTTLAAMIDHINSTRAVHIITIEDPIEFLHRDDQLDRQPARGRRRHASLRPRAAQRAAPGPRRHSRRRDARPRDDRDGAARGRDRPPRALDAAHPRRHRRRSTASSPSSRRTSRSRSGSSSPRVLKAVISQRLLPRADGRGRCPAVEVLIATPSIRDCIVDKDKTHLDPAAPSRRARRSTACRPSTSRSSALYQQDLVTYEEALRWATNVDEFKLKVQGIDHRGPARSRSDARPRSTSSRQPSRRRHAGAAACRCRRYADARRLLARPRTARRPQVRAHLRSDARSQPDARRTPSRETARTRTLVDDGRVAPTLATARIEGFVKRRGRPAASRRARCQRSGRAGTSSRRALADVLGERRRSGAIEAALAAPAARRASAEPSIAAYPADCCAGDSSAEVRSRVARSAPGSGRPPGREPDDPAERPASRYADVQWLPA